MSDLIPFTYDGREVRTVVVDGEPWFVLADLCHVLGLSNPTMVAQRLSDDDLSRTEVIDSMGRRQSVTIVNESGMYDVVLRSDKTEAINFRRWITGTVLPQIRKTGSYGIQARLEGPELLAAAVIESQRMLEARDARIHQLESRAAVDAPKVIYVDTYVTDADLLSFRTIAGAIGVQESWLRELLIEKRWIYRETASRWSEKKQAKVEVHRYSAHAEKKRYFRPVEVHDAPRFRNEVMHTLKVTPIGAEAIARLVGREAIAS